MELLKDLQAAEDFIFSYLGKDLRIATPLGLGKPNQLLNRLYDRAKNDSSVSLTLFTALSLDIPDPQSDLERRFVEPFYHRHFGENYPRLEYLRDLHKNKIPGNIAIHEFYFQAGSMLHNFLAQRNYISLNYTHVAQNIFDRGINSVIQLVAISQDGHRYSLSSNPDLTLDIHDLYKKNQKPLLIIGVVHPDLPFLGGDAEVDPGFFDAMLATKEINHKLFALPKASVSPVDYVIGLHASRLIRDNGTLQIGIGSLSDAIVYSTLLRHQSNSTYKKLLQEIEPDRSSVKDMDLHEDPFTQGLYGTSEMLMDGFMHLRKAGILKRTIFDRDEKVRRYLHGAFFLGSREFYQWLESLDSEDFSGLSMTRVSKVNDLYDEHELALRRQRKNARFFNTCMQVSLLGAAAFETLENGTVVSGVGGQYNFVSMSHELPDSQSVLMLKSTRRVHGNRVSNVVWSPGHLTIPRHLRDVVITEYGIAMLKGQSDETCIQRLLMITDSEFQGDLLAIAKKHGKISSHWQIPATAKKNNPNRIHRFIGDTKKMNLFPKFPFGSDFSNEEESLHAALQNLKEKRPFEVFKTLIKGCVVSAEGRHPELQRMKLQSPRSLQEFVFQRVLLGALDTTQSDSF